MLIVKHLYDYPQESTYFRHNTKKKKNIFKCKNGNKQAIQTRVDPNCSYLFQVGETGQLSNL